MDFTGHLIDPTIPWKADTFMITSVNRSGYQSWGSASITWLFPFWMNPSAEIMDTVKNGNAKCNWQEREC